MRPYSLNQPKIIDRNRAYSDRSQLDYYIMFFFSSLANNGKIPPEMSVIFPILILTIISTIGLIDANDK